MPARRSTDSLKEVIRDFRRDQVIEVARRLFGERGTTDVPMDEIAAEAGVARSTVYVYFANRDELLRACLKGMHNQLLEDIAQTWEEDAEPVHRLERLIQGMLERIDDDPAFFRLALMTQGTVIQGGEAVGTELALIGLNIARLIHDLYVEGVASGIFRDIDPDVAVNLVGQQIYGAMAVRAGETFPDAGPDSRGDHLHLHPPRTHGLTAQPPALLPDSGVSRRLSCRPAVSAAGDGRNDRDGLAVGHRGGQSVEKPHILVGDEHVDEPAQPAVVVEEPVAEAGIGTIERLEHLADRGALDGHLAGTAGQRAQLRRNSDIDAHRVLPSDASFIDRPPFLSPRQRPRA